MEVHLMGDIQEYGSPTFEAVWAMFQETGRRMKETDKQMKETDERMKETDKQIKETGSIVKETSRVVRELSGKLEKSKRELDRRMGDLGNRLGELAEHLVVPSINEKFNALGFHFDAIAPGGWRIDDPRSGQTLAEIDILLQNTETMIAVEVKAKLLEPHVDDHVKRLETLRAWADRHGDGRKIHGAVAGAIVSPSVRSYALKAGFYVIVQTGDTVKIDSPGIPRQW
jgi:hypothetical protein